MLVFLFGCVDLATIVFRLSVRNVECSYGNLMKCCSTWKPFLSFFCYFLFELWNHYQYIFANAVK